MVVLLHYVGNRFYTRDSFEREAKKYGVARALPLSVIKKLKFGQKIFLAFYKKDEKGKRYAEIFGYFVVSGLNYSGSKELTERIMKDKRVKIKHYSASGERVERGCGSYVITNTAVLDENTSLETLATVIEEHAKELNEKVRVMVTGEYYPLKRPVKLYNVKFTRSILKLNISEEELLSSKTVINTESKERMIVRVEDYSLRKYLSRKQREALITRKLDAWLVEG